MSEATKTPGYLFQMTCDIGNGKNIHVSGNFAVGVSTADMNVEIDKINAAFDRQRAKHEAPLIEERIEGTKQQITSREADLEEFRRQHPQAKGQFSLNIIKQEQELAALRVALTRGEITLAETQLKAQ